MPPRGRAWADTRFKQQSIVAGTDFIVDLLANAPTVDTLTAIRIVVDVHVHYIVTTTLADSDSIVDLGIGVASAEAVVAGAAALPDPASDSSYPPRGWLYVATGYVAQILTTDSGITNENAHFKADIRAMRKIDKGTLFVRVAQANLNTGGAMEMNGRIRVLCLT